MKRVVKYFIVFMVFFLAILMSNWIVWYTFSGGNKIPKKISEPFLKFASLPSLTHGFIINNFSFSDLRYIVDTSNSDGFQYFVDSSLLPDGKILISTLSQNRKYEIKLINIKNGQILKNWLISNNTLKPIIKKYEIDEGTIRLTHPLLMKDSSIIVNIESLLVCFNINNQIKWVNSEMFNHSIEQLNDTTLWACSEIDAIRPNSISEINTLSDRAIIEINSITGKSIYKKSIAELLAENGYQWLLAVGNYETDALHLNEVYPATYASKYWNQGDLLISLRHRSTVLLYRPSTNKIIWLKIGPWSNQHSCSFIDTSKILVFGNDVIRSGINTTTLLHGYNQLYIYDFATNTIATPYNKIMKQLQIKTLTEGRATYLTGGKVFIEETNYGKVYIIDSLKPILKYTERADLTHIKMFNWNRFIPN